MKKLFFVAVAILGLVACSSKYDKENVEIAHSALPIAKADNETELNIPPPTSKNKGYSANLKEVRIKTGSNDAVNPDLLDNVSETDKKIIKEGDISFETGDVAETRKQILATLKKLGGYIENDSESTNGEENRKDYTLNIRILAQSFDAFLSNVSATATKIDSKNIRISDVTTQFIDVKTRLSNKKLLEARYLDLLKKATKMSDVLEIESKLTEIRSDIESTQGQLNYMSKQVDYSTLSITFYTKQAAQVAAGNGFVYKLKQALAGGWLFIQNLFFGIVSLWPLWLAIFIVVLLLRRWGKSNAYKE